MDIKKILIIHLNECNFIALTFLITMHCIHGSIILFGFFHMKFIKQKINTFFLQSLALHGLDQNIYVIFCICLFEIVCKLFLNIKNYLPRVIFPIKNSLLKVKKTDPNNSLIFQNKIKLESIIINQRQDFLFL